MRFTGLERGRSVELDQYQQTAVDSDATPLLLLAGPGSGKTEVLTQRIVRRSKLDQSFDPRRALVVTFTRRAAQQLWVRLHSAGIPKVGAVGTFHAIALRQVRRFEESRELRSSERHTVLPSRRDLVSEMMSGKKTHRAPGTRGAGESATLKVKHVTSEIDWAKARSISPIEYGDTFGPERVGNARAQAITKIFVRYEKAKVERKQLDFDDVLAKCRQMMADDASFAAQLRWSLRHFFVDEFQDVNPQQFALLEAWLNGRSDLFAVGDPNQSIYGWNGAEPSYLTDFGSHFPDATVMELKVNRRSTLPIVKSAEAVLAGGAAVASAAELARKVGLANPDPEQPGQICFASTGAPPTFTGFADAISEAQGIAKLIKRLRVSGQRNNWGVLARSNDQLRLIFEALEAADVACKLSGRWSLLNRPEALKLREEISAVTNLAAFLGDLDLELAEAASERVGEGLAEEGLAEEPDSQPVSREFRRVLELAWSYERESQSHLASGSSPPVSGAGFEDWLSEQTPYDIDPVESSFGLVDLSTFHAAKGLQWQNVVIAGMNAGKVPLVRNDPEERRLLYVAMTRAKEGLHFTWDESASRSPWLDEIEAAANEEASPGIDPALGRDRIARLLKKMSAADSDSQPTSTSEVVAAQRRATLEEWRKATAQEFQLEAENVMDDDTLAVVARHGLSTLWALSQATGHSATRLKRLYNTLREKFPELLAKDGAETAGLARSVAADAAASTIDLASQAAPSNSAASDQLQLPV